MDMYGLSTMQHFWEPKKDNRVLMAWNANTVVIAFRGTATLKNAQTDMAVRHLSGI